MHEAQKLEAVGQSAAGIAYEINTPMQFIQNNVTFFARSFKDLQVLFNDYRAFAKRAATELGGDAAARLHNTDWDFLLEEIPESIAEANEGINRVVEIVSAMKEFSHPGKGVKELVDINRALRTTLTVSRNEWKNSAAIEESYDEQLGLVRCLQNEMNQVFLNIIVNATHAIADTGRTDPGVIGITTRKITEYVEIEITDDGCGILEPIRGKIFHPFLPPRRLDGGPVRAWRLLMISSFPSMAGN